MSAADLSRRWILTVRGGLATFLAIVAIVAVVLGLMYLFASGALPRLLVGHVHAAHHARRAAVCLAAGCACGVAAWLIRARRRDRRTGGTSGS